MNHAIRKLLLAASMLTVFPAAAMSAPDVVVSLKPIHSLVASIMHGVGEPGVLIDGGASPHTYQMKPSDASRLQKADLIFWVGPDMEKFMEKPLETLGARARIIELDNTPGLTRLPTRESGTFEAHDDGDEVHAHGEQEYDRHVWLSTDNARVMATAIAKALVEADPSNTQIYEKNLVRLNARLDKLSADIKVTVAPIKDRPFIVFHDAYQYFEKEFGVTVAGSITVSPENMPGAARIAEIHDKVKTLNSTCVFAEPQFEPKLIRVVLEGTSARTGVLDPEAGALTKGEDLYSELMMGIATSLKDCLSKN